MNGLKYIRKLNGLSMLQVGEKTDNSKQTVSKWESGKIKRISEDNLDKLSKLFNIPQKYFQKELTPIDELEIQRIKMENELEKIEIPEKIIDDLTGEEVNITTEYRNRGDMIKISQITYERNKSRLSKMIAESLDGCLKNADVDEDEVIDGLSNANELLEFYENFFYLVNNPKVNKSTLKEIMRAIKQSYEDKQLGIDSFTKEIIDSIRKHDAKLKKD